MALQKLTKTLIYNQQKAGLDDSCVWLNRTLLKFFNEKDYDSYHSHKEFSYVPGVKFTSCLA